MKTTKDTRSAILDVAQDLVQRRSISGVSFQELAKRIGIKKGSMYYHFESKDELAVAILDRVADGLKASFERGLHKTPTEQLLYFFRLYRQHIGVGIRICPGGAFAGEWEKLSEPVKRAAHRLIEVQRSGVERIITEGVANREFSLHGQSVRATANFIVSSIQGGLLTSRMLDSEDPFNDSAMLICGYLGINVTREALLG